MNEPIKLVSRISGKPLRFFMQLAKELPFRILVRAFIKVSPTSIRTKADWDAVSYPHYLVGVLRAADQAILEGVPEISVIEFGVAGGNGLSALEKHTAAVERETGIKIAVYRFDSGKGLPELCEGYRDHPDRWMPGDYPMDESLLRRRLSSRTALIIGNIAQTVSEFVCSVQSSPVGFIAFDLDLYSSTWDALQILLLPGKKMLRRVTVYFDDIDSFYSHRFAGELLAIDEFNKTNDNVKIDRWHGIANERVFPESSWLKKMYIAHDLDAISKVVLCRQPIRRLSLKLD